MKSINIKAFFLFEGGCTCKCDNVFFFSQRELFYEVKEVFTGEQNLFVVSIIEVIISRWHSQSWLIDLKQAQQCERFTFWYLFINKIKQRSWQNSIFVNRLHEIDKKQQ